MNIKTTIVAFSLLSVVSCGAFAAESINAQQAKDRQPMGSISVSSIEDSPMDIHAALSKKADEMGASAYRVTEARDGNSWHVVAELYK